MRKNDMGIQEKGGKERNRKKRDIKRKRKNET